MSTNSKAALLNWLKTGDCLLGNDSVFAIDKAKADRLLTQEYIRRFKTSSYLAPVNGETDPDNGYKVFMQNFILDHPRLSFDNASITSSRASLRMRILGGDQVGLKQVGANWYPQRIDRIEPLVGPELRLNLQLSDVPGYVDDGGSITLDLRNSDDFVMTFSDSRRIRELGGDFFKEQFQKLPDEKRIWSLGRVEHGDDDVMRPQSFNLYTQRNPSSASSPMAIDDDPDVDGAVLGCVRMIASTGGQSAIPGPDYRYLIPEGSEGYSATVLFERNRVILATLLRQLPRQYFKEVEFNIKQDDQRGLTVTATAGWLEFPPTRHSGSLTRRDGARHVQCEADVEVTATRIALRDVLQLQVSGDRIAFSMTGSTQVRNQVLRYEEVSYAPGPYMNPGAVEGGWLYEANLDFSADWTLTEAQGGLLELNNFQLTLDTADANFRRDEASPPAEGLEKAFDFTHFWWVFGVPFAALDALTNQPALLAVRSALAKDLTTDLQVDHVIAETLKLSFGGAIIGADLHLPRDFASFGRVNPRQTTFVVKPLESVVRHGGQLQLFTEPKQENVQWSVESVEGSADDAGHFDRNIEGLYLAPDASGIQGDFTRVRLTATDQATGFSSSALITVVKNALNVSPLLEVCQVGDVGVSLKGGHVAEGELSWQILGSQAHGTLAHETGAANTYIPGEPPQGRTFVVEEVEVGFSTGDRRTVCLITTSKRNPPTTVIMPKLDVKLGRAWLLLHGGGAALPGELTVVHGPGQIVKDEDGNPYYQAVPSDAPFSVVRCNLQTEAEIEFPPGSGNMIPIPLNYDGFIVLPLPLVEHPGAYETLERAARRLTRR